MEGRRGRGKKCRAGSETRKNGGCLEVSGLRAYLIRVHFKLPHHLDGDFIMRLRISGLVNVAEGAVAHLFNQDVSFQARILGHLSGSLPLFGDNGFDIGLVDFLLFALLVGSHSASLCSHISVIDGGGRVLAGMRLSLVVVVVWLLLLLLPLHASRLRYAMAIFLRLSVDVGDVGGRLIAGWLSNAGLLAMTYEVLEVLNGAHV